MKLKVSGIIQDFEVETFTITQDEILIQSSEAAEVIEKGIFAKADETVAAPPPAPAPVATILAAVPEKLGEFTVAQMKESGWNEAQLLEHGYLKEVPAEEVSVDAADIPPTAPPVPAKDEPITKFTHDEKNYRMAPKAAGGTLDQFLSKGWSIEDVISEGFAELDEVEPTTFPYRNDSNEWVDSAGVIFDAEKHSMTKANVPGVTVKGLFKKKRGYKGDKQDVVDPNQSDAAKDVAPPPAAPSVPTPTTDASAAPAAPSAPTAPSTDDDEDIDEELEGIIKGWNS